MEKYRAVSLPVFTQWKDYQSLGTRFVPLLLLVWMGFKDHLTHNSLLCVTENSGMLKLLCRNNRQSFCTGFSFCAPASVAGESRHIHIPSSPHQRREPRLPPRLWQGAGAMRAADFLLPPHPSECSFPGGMGVGGSEGLQVDTASVPSIARGSRSWHPHTVLGLEVWWLAQHLAPMWPRERWVLCSCRPPCSQAGEQPWGFVLSFTTS